eukprot:SAG22_NODE_1404_length_4491_cov_3.411885_2_plen_356_part_00
MYLSHACTCTQPSIQLYAYTVVFYYRSRCWAPELPIDLAIAVGADGGLTIAGELVRQDAVACLGRSRPDRTVLCATGVLRDAAARLSVFLLLLLLLAIKIDARRRLADGQTTGASASTTPHNAHAIMLRTRDTRQPFGTPHRSWRCSGEYLAVGRCLTGAHARRESSSSLPPPPSLCRRSMCVLPAGGSDRDALLGPAAASAGAWRLDNSRFFLDTKRDFSVSKSVLHDSARGVTCISAVLYNYKLSKVYKKCTCATRRRALSPSRARARSAVVCSSKKCATSTRAGARGRGARVTPGYRSSSPLIDRSAALSNCGSSRCAAPRASPAQQCRRGPCSSSSAPCTSTSTRRRRRPS